MKLTMLVPAIAWTLVPSVHALLHFSAGESEYKLAQQDTAPVIKVAGDDFPAVHRTAQDLAEDFGRVVGTNGSVSIINGTALSQPSKEGQPVIIAGTIGNSSLIDRLISDSKLDVSETEGQWEAYTTTVVTEPADGIPWALVIAGSDRRGTIYGMYDISEEMGVSPWYWWADVPVKTKTEVWVSGEPKFQGTPSIKYRGFFINDEAPALSGWIEENFGSFNSEFYGLVFELLLRLKGNYLWPAMWGRMFYVEDEKNGPLAEEYGVIMGTSHHEPMARSEREQQLYNNGDWDWIDNSDNITAFFEEGVERAVGWDTIFTMGMRGSGDEASPTLTAEALEEIIQVQQGILMDYFNTTDLMSIPQTWVLYKEVGEYYKAGLDVPNSVTLLWTDDNSGNLLRVPIANETDRDAGAGVYYHFDYVGAPRSYKWINSIQLVKTWEQMQLAWEKNAREIWIANVGDIKPLEIPLTHFMDMAYDMDKYERPDSTTAWIKRWATSEFGESVADVTADILNEYGILLTRCKYELLSERPFAFSTENYNEAERHLERWEDLLKLTEETYESLDEETQIAYFQMIMHPVMAGKTVNDLYIKVALGERYAEQGRVSANALAQEAHDLFEYDEEIADMYHSLNGGKWNHFVNQAHIGYTSWDDPPNNTNIMPNVSYTGQDNVTVTDPLGVGIQGSNESYHGGTSVMLLPVDPYLPENDQRYIEVFARNNGTFDYSISSNASYITISDDEGTLSAPGDATDSDVRNYIQVDWDAAPDGMSWVGLHVTSDDSGNSTIATAVLPVNKISVPSDFSGYVESNGVVSVEAAHYADVEEKNGLSYVEIPHYGRTLSGVKLWPVNVDSQTAETAPAISYSLYTTTSTDSARLVIMLGTSLNHDPTRLLKFAYSLDGSEPEEIEPVYDEPQYLEGPEWREAIVGGGWTSTIEIDAEVNVGEHELKLWLLEPGVVVQKVMLDMGGLQSSALGPPESSLV